MRVQIWSRNAGNFEQTGGTELPLRGHVGRARTSVSAQHVFFSSLLLSSLELIDTNVYEP